MSEFITHSREETVALGAQVAQHLAPGAHFDLYRISTENDLCAAGFYDYLDEGAVVAAEWSENFADLLALEDPIHINIERVDDTTRRITIEGVEV